MLQLPIIIRAALLCALSTVAEENFEFDYYSYFGIEVLVSEIDQLSRLTFDWTTNTLFFNYYDRNNKVFKSAKYNLYDQELKVIEELVGLCVVTVDQISGQTYAGCKNDSGHGGLFWFSRNKDKFVLIAEEGKDIEFAFFYKVLYYVLNPAGTVHKYYANGQVDRVSDMINATGVKQLIITKNHDERFFFNDTGLYRQMPEDRIVLESKEQVIALTLQFSGAVGYCTKEYITCIYYDRDDKAIYIKGESENATIVRDIYYYLYV